MTDPAGAVLRPTTAADLRALVDRELGPTGWLALDQAAIDAFAELTGDRQWIHVDPVRAASSSFGSTIGHGLLTLSRGPALFEELMSFDGFAHSLNYGYGKVRFPAPLPVGSRIRMRATIVAVDDVPGGAQITIRQTFEREGHAKPVCVAEQIGRFTEHGA